MQITRSVRQKIFDRAAMMVNHTEQVWSRQARSLASVLAGAPVASLFQPALQKEGCKTLSAFGVCKDHKAKMIENLHQSLRQNRRMVNQMSAETETAIVALNCKADATQENFQLLSADAQIKTSMATQTIRVEARLSQGKFGSWLGNDLRLGKRYYSVDKCCQ